jgi:hypothetical protein
MLEQRVGRLEEDVREIRTELKSISQILVDLRERLSRIEGKLDRTPDASQMWRMVVGTWVAGAGIVMLAVKLLTP